MINDTNEGIDFGVNSDIGSDTSTKKHVTFNAATKRDFITNEAYKTLRTNFMFSCRNVKTVVITSCSDSEGKSTISTELAKSLAEIGKRTLFIDADMRRSTILRRSSSAEKIHGLSELLSGLAEPKDVIYGTQYDNFDVIFSGSFPPNPVELIGNGYFEKFIDDFKKDYDYVIIDSPPLGMVIDAALIGSYVDGAIMVIANRRVTRKDALSVKAQLERSGCKILGTVINETDKKYAEHRNGYQSREYRIDKKTK